MRDSDGIVRESAVEALARIGTLDAIAPLVAALEDANRSLRVASGAALKACGWKPGNKMLAALLAVACKRWSEAVRLAEVSVEPLARELLQPDWGYSQVLEAAVRAAAALGEIGLASGATVLLKVIEREAADHNGHPGPRRAIVEAAVRGLEGVFSHNARNVSMEDLQAIGRLSEGAAISLWHSGSVTNFVESWTVDASRLQLLASEELSRRSAERA